MVAYGKNITFDKDTEIYVYADRCMIETAFTAENPSAIDTIIPFQIREVGDVSPNLAAKRS